MTALDSPPKDHQRLTRVHVDSSVTEPNFLISSFILAVRQQKRALLRVAERAEVSPALQNDGANTARTLED
jgi:hypothetical protein